MRTLSITVVGILAGYASAPYWVPDLLVVIYGMGY